ncbi:MULTISPECIES: hypothetical protein [unclassified Mesorhizobium]|nr:MULTISPECIES: hypothetical protein [unclassified Mesorhizobium]
MAQSLPRATPAEIAAVATDQAPPVLQVEGLDKTMPAMAVH